MLIGKLLLTIVLLYTAFSFLFNQFHSRSSLRKALFNLCIMLCSIPVVFAVYTTKANGPKIIKLDIDVAFNITWAVTAAVFFFGLWLVKVNKN